MNTPRCITFLLVFLLLAVSGCSCGGEKPPETGTVPDAGDAIALAQRFSPVFYLKGDTGTTESYEPAPIETLVSQALFLETDNLEFSEKASLPGLSEHRDSSYYLDVPDLSPASAPDILPGYKKTYEELKQSGYAPTVYARVIENISGKYTVLQYWTFYYFNDWRNVHEGDWELVQLVFPGLTAEQLVDTGREPLFAAYSQHQAGQRMSWETMRAEGLLVDNHPSVYVAQGSHANYFTPGQYWSVLDFDDTGLESWNRIENADIVLLQEEGSDDPNWLSFQGKWGEDLSFSISIAQMTFGQSGPTGPSWGGGGQPSTKWESPYAWAEGLPEYPAPFWASFIPGLAKFWPKLAVFSVFSPADLHVYDAAGRHVGLDESGKLEVGIPGAEYLTPTGSDYKTIVVPDGDVTNGFKVELSGTGEGVMDIKTQVPDEQAVKKQFVAYAGIPVTVRTVARLDLSIRPQYAVANDKSDSIRDVTTRLEIDTDGDGIFESKVEPGRSDIIINPTVTPTTVKPTITTTIKPTITTTTVTPTIERVTMTLAVKGDGGTVKMSPESGLVSGSRVTVTAVADTGWVFDHWEGDFSGTEPVMDVILKKDMVAVAVFKQDTAGLLLDQEHAPPWDNGILVSINPDDHTRQTFTPNYSLLMAIDVNLCMFELSQSEVDGEYVTIYLYNDNGGLLAAAKIWVKYGTDGWVRFEFADGVQLPPGYPVTIELADEGNYAFGWKFSLEDYKQGLAVVEGKVWEVGDYLFRTYTAGTIAGRN